jgi:hypothetical protein
MLEMLTAVKWEAEEFALNISRFSDLIEAS